jgi:DNA segregation ATPase FtsK/SpoIIIE, S-DNA-T family
MARRRGFSLSFIDWNDERVPKIVGALLLFLAAYMTIAFTSYLFTWADDMSLVQPPTLDNFLSSEAEYTNWLGRLGAFASHWLIDWSFGLPSFILIYLAFVYGWAYMRSEDVEYLKIRRRYLLLLMVFLSILLAFLFQRFEFNFGGTFGRGISLWIVSFVGNIGMVLILLLLAFALITWNFNPNYKEMTYEQAKEGTKGWLNDYFSRRFRAREVPVATRRTRNAAAQAESTEDMDIVVPTVVTTSKVYNSIDSIDDTVRELDPLEDATGENAEGVLDENGQLAFNINRNVEMQQRGKTGDTTLEIEEVLPEPQASADPELARMEALVAQQNIAARPQPVEYQGPYDPTLELSHYEYPVTPLLVDYSDQKVEVDRAELEANKDQIIATLLNYKIEIVKIRATIGPTVTLYEIVPAPGIRISKIKSLEDDIALSLAALGIRIIAPIPGRGTIGIEVPNKNKQIVSLREVLQSEKFKRTDMDLPIALGKTISNEVFVADLTKMPHLLIAGATGQGKSVGINTILMSLLYKKHPSQVKIVLVDPKKVELFPYAALENHFLGFLPDQKEPIITDTSKVVHTLLSLCQEMDTRYDLLKKAGARNIKEYNEKFIARQLNPNNGHQYLPFIVLIVDEFADLIMTAGKEVEVPIGRLAQLSRAVGIHLIIATQRPSVNIITGVIKANFPARLAFKVSSKVDSRTILDTGGADQLIGRGDMLLSIGGDNIRLQCAFVDTPEVESVINFISQQQGFPEPYYLPEVNTGEGEFGGKEAFKPSELDDMFDDAARLVVESQHGSTSMIQRRMKLGYNRAGRIMDQLESMGIVGPSEGSKPREVLMYDVLELERFLSDLATKR